MRHHGPESAVLTSPEAPAPRAWVGVVSRGHVLRGVEGGFAQLCHGKRLSLERMNVGDWLVFYSPRTDLHGGEPLRAFTALGRVQGRHAEPFDMGGGFVPYRREVRFERAAREVLLARLTERLGFIRDNPHWGMLARRGHFEISLEDLRLIATAMGVDSPGLILAPPADRS